MRKTKLGNKGFSLVELIIVIAIMAVLIGILAPMFIRYVETSRIQTDVTTIDQIAKALQTAVMDPAIGTVTDQTVAWDAATGTITGGDQAVRGALAATLGGTATAAASGTVTSAAARSAAASGATVNIAVSASTGSINITGNKGSGSRWSDFETGVEDIDSDGTVSFT
ncbi:MAG: prepilin-type N-terminal cleavage/methylation domain-containing protein [Oscillospiraceae bacterium]|jgi:type IV pilus assembly protein PilA|nr:prepilin-type N-terminal cleavage/methylation domain-containing protein [Oscillospiraceae bacterium]